MNVLGIETSCDETAAAVVVDGKAVLSSVVASQVAVHHAYGGVVPELASRKHMEAIVPVVREALARAELSLADMHAVAATQGPGLVGALLVGFSFARALAYARSLPFYGVNHLEGHLNSVFLAPDPPEFPFVTLLASGGHTSIYHVSGHTAFEPMGQSLDDAAGEAFDKVSKMMGLGYPGGAAVSALAREGDPARIAFPRAFLEKDAFDFSFSGLKSAVSRHLQTHPNPTPADVRDIAASFQEAVCDVLSAKLLAAAEARKVRHMALVGGVAANQRLREAVTRLSEGRGLRLHIPDAALCGDNAAMIAAAGYHHLKTGEVSSPDADVYSRYRPPASA